MHIKFTTKNTFFKNKKGLGKLFVLFIFLCFGFSDGWGQISENFQSWTSKGSYTTASQAGSGGTWNYVSCIVSPGGAANGTGSAGLVQMQSDNGILTLPNIASGGVGTITIQARVSGANGGFSIEKNVNSAGWASVQALTSSSTTAVQFQVTVNDASANIQLRINNTGGSGSRALYVHDVVTTVGATIPTLTLSTVASIATTTATLGATVTSNGGATLTSRGTVWGTSANPTGNALAEGGTTVALFTHGRTGFTANTVYNYRGYAINSVGTGYSPNATFTTLHNAPNIGSGSGATATSFTASWTAPTGGGPASFTYEIQVNDDNTFTNGNEFAQSSISSATTSVNVNTGLSASTVYYYRVRAVNAGGNSAWSTVSVGYSTLSAITINISNTNLAQFTTQNLTRNTVSTPASRFQVTVTGGTATLSSLSFVTPNNGTTNSYVNTDLSNFKLYYTTGTTFNTTTPVAGASAQVSGKALTTTGETITFSGLSQTLVAGTYYIWVTADILGTATAGRTLTVNAPTLTASVGSVTGTSTATGVQTIVAATPTNYFLTANNAGSASNWNTAADGSGTTLSSLNNPTDVNLIVDDETNASISGDITLGNNSKFIISQGSNAKLTLDGCAVTATIDVGTAGTLDFFNSAAQQASTTIGTLATGSTIAYSNNANQTIPRTINYSNLFITGAATKTAASGGAISVAGNLTVSAGTFVLNGVNNLALAGTLYIASGATFDNGGESQITNSGGTINIAGTFITRDAEGFTGTNTAIPSIVPTLNSGCNIVYGLSGNQTITDATYQNITFSGSGIKSTTGAVSSITGTVTINAGVTVNSANNTFGGASTSLTMMAGSRFITGGSGTKPNISGTYNLDASSVIEFSGSSATIIRTSPTYGSIDVSGTNVSLSGTGTSITLQSLGNFTVKTGGVFNVENVNGFSDAANTAINNINSPTITLESGSTINYSSTAQPITPRSDYSNLTIANSGVKTAASAFTVNGIFTRTGSATLGTTSPTFGASSTLAYVDATNNQVYTAGLEWPLSDPPTNVTINLSGTGTTAVTMPGDRTITGALTQTAGNLNINGNTLTLNGTYTGSGLLQGSATSNLSIGGTGALGTLNFDQTTDGTTNALSNLTINRTSSGTAILGNKLVLIDVLTPTAGTLTTGGFLHLRSTAANTARIAQGSSAGNYISGDVTVERYISASNNRAYRLLAPTVTTSTSINANWQEGKANTAVNVNIPSDVAGYGTHITGSGGSSNGFDATQTNQGSLYTYTYNPDAWTLVTNTNVNTLNANTGYLLFVRGNRDDIATINTATGNSNTTLRAKGALTLGDQTLTNLSSDGNVTLIANPFASPIRWDATSGLYTGTNATNFENYITIWDPNIGSRGGFVTVNTSGLTGGGATNLTGDIQSGQAFFIQAKEGVMSPSLTITESNKSTVNNLDVYRTGTQTETLKTLLYYTDNTGTIRSADGVTSIFNNSFSNGLNGEDAQQIDNWDEDVSIARDSKFLSIEARNLADANDTIPLAIARFKTQAYQWKLVPANFNAPSLSAFLRDNFINTNTPISLSDTTVINFTATADPASKAANRFSIIFKQNGTLPVTVSNIKAYAKNSGVQIEWQSSNEINIGRYGVEKSSDAVHFTKLNTQAAIGVSSYNSFDASPVTGNNFYRIKIVENTGGISYTPVVKVAIGKFNNQLVIYPNPIVHNQVGLQVNELAKGNYQISITNAVGQMVFTQKLQHAGGALNENLQLNKQVLAIGVYQIKVEGGESIRLIQTFLKE